MNEQEVIDTFNLEIASDDNQKLFFVNGTNVLPEMTEFFFIDETTHPPNELIGGEPPNIIFIVRYGATSLEHNFSMIVPDRVKNTKILPSILVSEVVTEFARNPDTRQHIENALR